MTKLFDRTISESNIITIFRHVNPDFDALSSQHALKEFINLKYPNKEVYMLGNENLSNDCFSKMDVISDDIIKKSTAIILDTANQERIDDQRYKLAEKIMRIDHHLLVDDFGDVKIIWDNYAATCEILTEIFTNHSYQITTNIAKHLYRGILTDTLCFKTTNTTEHTLKMAARLAQYNINIPVLNQEIFDLSYNEYQFINLIRSKVQVINNLAYIMCSIEDYEKFNLTSNDVGKYVNVMGNVKEFMIWCLFTETSSNIYKASLRSKAVAINEVANKYHGGGHKNACGVKNLTQEDITYLLNDLQSLLD